MIEFQNVSLSYPGAKLFENFSFRVGRGEQATLVGPSGSGKSSLFRLILGLERPDSGRILVNETALSPDTRLEVRRKIAWAPQNFSQTNGETGLEAVRDIFQLRCNANISPSENEITETRKALLLEDGVLERKLQDLSGGQKQRLSILFALLLKRPILLLDEFTSSLDSRTRARVMDLILERNDLTVLAASHDEHWIKRSDYVLTMPRREGEGD